MAGKPGFEISPHRQKTCRYGNWMASGLTCGQPLVFLRHSRQETIQESDGTVSISNITTRTVGILGVWRIIQDESASSPRLLRFCTHANKAGCMISLVPIGRASGVLILLYKAVSELIDKSLYRFSLPLQMSACISPRFMNHTLQILFLNSITYCVFFM